MAGRDRGRIFKRGIALELWKREISSAESGDSGKGRGQRRRVSWNLRKKLSRPLLRLPHQPLRKVLLMIVNFDHPGRHHQLMPRRPSKETDSGRKDYREP